MKLKDIFERDEVIRNGRYNNETLGFVIPVAYNFLISTSKDREFTCSISADNFDKIRKESAEIDYCTMEGIMELNFDSIKEGRHAPF